MTLDERAKVRIETLAEVAEAIKEFSWVLPVYPNKEVNELTDDSAEAVREQIAAMIQKLVSQEEVGVYLRARVRLAKRAEAAAEAGSDGESSSGL